MTKSEKVIEQKYISGHGKVGDQVKIMLEVNKILYTEDSIESKKAVERS